jgi:hypothetical protein
VLAYVFWHRSSGETSSYEEALAAFHRALAAEPPAGFARSLAVRLDAAPWLPGDGEVYEDWYLVDDWAALGALNVAAVSGSRRPDHDAVAARATTGVAGIYAPFLPGARPEGAHATWRAKPPGTSYAEWRERLAAADASVWQRQMTLGPTPEFGLLADASAGAGEDGAVATRRRPVATGAEPRTA